MSEGTMRYVTAEEVKDAFALEKAGYPEDEVASHDTLVYRQKEAPLLFRGFFQEETLLGYMCATRYPGPPFDAKSMKQHKPNASSVCIHSVCVAKEHRRKGIALKMLRDYTENVKKTQPGVIRLLLLCKSGLIPLYTKAGYTFMGKSRVTHGNDPWYEMELNI